MKEERENEMVELWGEEDGRNGCSSLPPSLSGSGLEGTKKKKRRVEGGLEAYVHITCVFKWEQAEEHLPRTENEARPSVREKKEKRREGGRQAGLRVGQGPAKEKQERKRATWGRGKKVRRRAEVVEIELGS